MKLSWGSKGSMKAPFGGDETSGRFADARKARCLECVNSREGCNGRRAAGLPCQDVLVSQYTSCSPRETLDSTIHTEDIRLQDGNAHWLSKQGPP